MHEQIRDDLRDGRIGLAHNRLPVETEIEDIQEGDVAVMDGDKAAAERGQAALAEGRVAVLSLAAGMGSRWTMGAGPRSEAGEARPTLPPMVARARTGGEARIDAACARPGQRSETFKPARSRARPGARGARVRISANSHVDRLELRRHDVVGRVPDVGASELQPGVTGTNGRKL